MLVILCVMLLTPVLASASLASANGSGNVSINISNCLTSQADTDWATSAIAHDQFVEAGDSHSKHYGDPEPSVNTSFVSLESNPLSLNPILAMSSTEASFSTPETPRLYMLASSYANAGMNNWEPSPISATANSDSGLRFRRSNMGSVTVTVEYNYTLELLNAANGIWPGSPPDAAGDIMLEVGLYNSAGQSLLSAKDGWILQGDILQRLYHVGAGTNISEYNMSSSWQVNNLTTYDTYTLVVGAYASTLTYAPEPTTICLLGLGALGLLKKRRV